MKIKAELNQGNWQQTKNEKNQWNQKLYKQQAMVLIMGITKTIKKVIIKIK